MARQRQPPITSNQGSSPGLFVNFPSSRSLVNNSVARTVIYSPSRSTLSQPRQVSPFQTKLVFHRINRRDAHLQSMLHPALMPRCPPATMVFANMLPSCRISRPKTRMRLSQTPSSSSMLATGCGRLTAAWSQRAETTSVSGCECWITCESYLTYRSSRGCESVSRRRRR
jgi:hypothetical protein